MLFDTISISFLLLCLASGSTSIKSSQSALVISFEKTYEQSLLAHTLFGQSIEPTLIITASASRRLYENLQGIEVLKLDTHDDPSADKAALNACETLLTDQNILNRVREIEPTFVIFPALRHDACLLPWARFINSIPVIVTYGPEEDLYTVQRTLIALPIHTGGLWSGFWANADSSSVIANANSAYVAPALKLAKQNLPEIEIDFDQLYSNVEVVFSSGDPILRSDFALLGRQPVQIGCHHCRGAHPLPPGLQKELVEFRLGTVVSTLDESFAPVIEKLAQTLPQGRQGLAIAWKNIDVKFADEKKPENVFVHGEVDRQDLIGYARARVLLSHCQEVELLEAVFHGTPVICFPRDFYERSNEKQAIELGFATSTNGDTSVNAIVEAIELVHKTTGYREVSRSFSSIIRDRPLPASDSLVYWLGYASRNAERAIKPPVLRANEVRTLIGDSQLLSSFLIGIIIGGILALAAIFTWFRSKSIQKRSRKDKRFAQ